VSVNKATNGTVNTGGGGGGAGRDSTLNYNCAGGDGGSGVVVLRFPNVFTPTTTGSPTITTSGGYKVYTYTGSGSITF
jgi:hypothetical protein